MTRTIAILGRPNVGKSTLFNRLVGRRQALVHDEPGVTRDRIEGEARLFDLAFKVVDTAGLEVGLEGALSERLVEKSLKGLDEADAGVFLIDARAGVTALDRTIADLLRKRGKPVVLAANKCEGRAAEAEAAGAWGLGLGEPVWLSAEHGLGLDELAERLRPYVGAGEEEEAGEGDEGEPETLRLAIVGRPNVGKSSLVNRLLREERQLTGPEPGLTRDAVRLPWRWRGRPVELVDTAGLRRKARIDQRLERISASASVRAIREAHVVLLLVDATQPLEKQDLAIAGLALDEGRALVLAANKWDLVEDQKETRDEILFRMKHKLSQLKDLPFVPFSVLTGRGLERLLPAVAQAFERWSTRVPTSRLNRWLGDALAKNPPPMAQNRRIKIRYATQAATRPPTIALFANKPEADIPDSYKRYLLSSFVETFGLQGVPLRLRFRHGENPYAKD
ncbi:MAG: ribosome biogenesis GTPase Der [Geminicoccaceae bacterium]|nr:ribosome biogenesis GTPase Der [Geminicoccaceae bacterium]